jgi:hypothetical protein
MSAEKKKFPLRAHHLDFAFSMAVTLDRLKKSDIKISDALRPLLEGKEIEFEKLTENDFLFLKLLTNLAWHFRKKFEVKKGTDREYDQDVLGTNPEKFDQYIDQQILAATRSIVAIYLKDIVIEIGDVLDGHCLACALAFHCMELKQDDWAIMTQLGFFADGVVAPTPSNTFDVATAKDIVQQYRSETVRAFLTDRTDNPLLDKLPLEDDVVVAVMFYRSFLMVKKRGRNYSVT